MNGIMIVEYQRKYAKSLAEMWNKSAANWGGFDSPTTEANVIEENENGDYQRVWLALEAEEVVGYCTYSEYREDIGAAYIPLLNVRPDCQGKKVGKQLVLKALEAACQDNWARLDLYTWPGNTKATPLYKKCGFFWEDRDDTTHLMNFLPTVLKTEAVKDFFKGVDWYQDSKRPIIVEPDGRKENGFDYLEYHWEKAGSMLKMEFERRGRGIRLIETDDYVVSANVENLNLVFGRSYSVTYKIHNKSGNPLEVEIRGLDDQNIQFDLNSKVRVVEQTTVKGQFTIGEIKEEQNLWRTHPTVTAQVKINGKEALFKVGVVPKFPAAAKVVLPQGEYFAGTKGEFYINLENSFLEPAKFEIILPHADFIQLETRKLQVELAAKEKRALKVPYVLNFPGILAGSLEIVAIPQSGGEIRFKRLIAALFNGPGSLVWGEDDDQWVMANGRNVISLSKFNNIAEIRTPDNDDFSAMYFRPQLGRPYSSEFSKTRPISIEFAQDHGKVTMLAIYNSKAFPGIQLQRALTLSSEGLAQQSWEILNIGNGQEELWFKEGLRTSLIKGVAPIRGQVVEARDGYGESIHSFQAQDYSENWLFAHGARPRGVCWPEDWKPVYDQGCLMFDHCLKLEPGKSIKTQPVTFAIGTFGNWQQLRQFALGHRGGEVIDSLAFEINGGNPFIQGEVEAKVTDYKNMFFKGEFTLSSQGHVLVRRENQDGNVVTLPKFLPHGPIDIVTMEADLEALVLRRKSAVFTVQGEISTLDEEVQGHRVLTVDNGVVKFSAAPEFGPVLHSLEYGGKQWLDNSFPQSQPKSWWNPWLGGMVLGFDGFALRSVLQEDRSGGFVTLEDNKGNLWQGIQLETNVRTNERHQELVIRQYFLTLPGLLGICNYIELEMPSTGLALKGLEFGTEMFLAPDGSTEGCWVEAPSQLGQVRFKMGAGAQTKRANKLLVGSNNSNIRLVITSGLELTAYTNQEVMVAGDWNHESLVPGQKITTKPIFSIFTPEDLPVDALEALHKIRF